jgi:hypothetical protein
MRFCTPTAGCRGRDRASAQATAGRRRTLPVGAAEPTDPLLRTLDFNPLVVGLNPADDGALCIGSSTASLPRWRGSRCAPAGRRTSRSSYCAISKPCFAARSIDPPSTTLTRHYWLQSHEHSPGAPTVNATPVTVPLGSGLRWSTDPASWNSWLRSTRSSNGRGAGATLARCSRLSGIGSSGRTSP